MCSKRHAVIASGFYDSGIDLLGQFFMRSKAIVDSNFKPVGLLIKMGKSQRIRLLGRICREYFASQKQTGNRLILNSGVVPHLERFGRRIPEADYGCHTIPGIEFEL